MPTTQKKSKNISDVNLRKAIRIIEKTGEACRRINSQIERYEIITRDLKKINALLDEALKEYD